MSRITRSVFAPSNLHIVFAPASLEPLVNIWRTLMHGIVDPYRPELHYMRGPGPKWREKHARVTSLLSISHHR